MSQQPSVDLKARILEAARERPAPARAQRAAFAVLAPFGAAAILAIIILYASGGPRHAEGRPAPIGLAVALGCVVVAAIASAALLSRRKSMVGASRELLWLVVIGTPLAAAAWTLGWHVSYFDPFERLGVRCFLMSLATAPWLLGALVHARRRIDPVHPRLFGAALGTVAGAWAGVVVVLWCPLADPGHVIRGHLTPFLVLSLAGAWLGARFFALKNPN